METPRKVFLTYRSVDRDRVRAVAETLRAQGIDAWWDVWEILPGDNFVARVNTGLEQCDCGVVFLSNASLAGAWQQDEITIIKTFAVDERRPLIPVLLDTDVKVPSILRPYSRLSADRLTEVADAIRYLAAGKPARGLPATMTEDRPERFDVFLSHSHTEAEAVEMIGSMLEDEEGLRVWFDRWILIPGEHWQQEMAKGLDQARTCAVFVGASTPSGWFREEVQRELNRQTKDSGFRVIPVILPSGDRQLINDFLELRTWVEFKTGLRDPDAFYRLVCGVRGDRPGRRRPSTMAENDALALLRATLSNIRDLRAEKLIDEEIALEFQRKLLDGLVKTER